MLCLLVKVGGVLVNWSSDGGDSLLGQVAARPIRASETLLVCRAGAIENSDSRCRCASSSCLLNSSIVIDRVLVVVV